MTVPPPPPYPPAPIPPPRPVPDKRSRTALAISLIVGAGLLAAALVVLGVLSSASGDAARADGTYSPKPAPSTAFATPSSDPPAGVMDDSPQPPPLSTTVAEFGDTWTWEDGVAASVVSATQYEIGAYASGAGNGEVGIIVTVTVTNGSAGLLDLDLCRVDLRAGDLGVVAGQVYDSENVGKQLAGVLAPGQVATGQVAFGVDPANVAKLDITVTPTDDYETALFSGVAG